MAATFATLLALLAVQQAAVLASDHSWGHHHHKAPTVVDVVRYGQACPCAKTLPFELEVPVQPKEPKLHTYGYAIEAPPPRQPLPLYSYDYELEVPVKKHPPIKRTYGYEVQAPAPRQPLPLYSYDYELEVPHRSPEPPKLHGLETRLDRVLLPKHDCPWGAQAGALLRSARALPLGHAAGYGYVEPDEEPGAGRVVPLSGRTRILPTSGPALPPADEFYDGGKTYEVVNSSPLALISGGDGGRRGFYPEDLDSPTKPWSPLQGPAYFAGSVLGRDFRSDLHFAPERPRILDQPPAGRYQVNRYGRDCNHTHHPEGEGGRRSRRAVSVRFTLSEGYDSLEEDELFVHQPSRPWRGKYVTDRMGPHYTWKGTKQANIIDPDDLDDLAFRHPLDRYFTNVKDWKEVADFKSKVLGSGNYRHGFVKSPRAPWWRPSRPVYRPPTLHSAVRSSFQQGTSDYLAPAPKALPKTVYSLKVLPDAAYDDVYKVATVRPKTFSHVPAKDTYDKIVYDDNYRSNGFDSHFAGNELRNRFNGRFQEQRLPSSTVKGYSPVPYFGRLGTYTLGPFVTEKPGSGFNNIRDSVVRHDVFSTKSLTHGHSEEDFSLDEVDRQLLEEEKRGANQKVDNIPDEGLNSDKTSKPLSSDVYSLKVLPDPVVDDQYSLEEIDKVQMISLAKDSSPPVSDEFSPDLAPLKKLPIGNRLNILPNTDILPGTNIFASINTLPSSNILPTTKIDHDTSNTPDLLHPSPDAFAYDLDTVPGFVSGKVNQLSTFSSLLSDEFHLLDRGPAKLHEKKNIKELNSEAPEEVNAVFFDGERHETEAVPKSSEEEPEPQHREDVATVGNEEPVMHVLTESVSHETKAEAIQGATGGSEEAVKQKSEAEADVHSMLASEKGIKSEEIPTGEALPNAEPPVEKIGSSNEENTFAEGQVAEDNKLVENNDPVFANSAQNSKEQQEGLLEGNSREETIIIENQPELSTTDEPAFTVVGELGSAGPIEPSSAGPIEPSSAEPIGDQAALDAPQLSDQLLDTEAVEQELTAAADADTQKVETTIVPLESLHWDTRDLQLGDHHHDLDAVDAEEGFDNRPWYGLWYGHGNEVKSEGLPKLYQLHDAILERNKQGGEETDQQQEAGKISPEQTTEISPSVGHNDQEVLAESSPVTEIPVMYHHHVYPQETEAKSPEAVFDYYPRHFSTGRMHQPHGLKDEKWPYILPPVEESTHASPSTDSPKASPVPRPQHSWFYPERASNHYGEKWDMAPAHQPSTYSHFSKGDRHTQPGHELVAAPKYGLAWGNPKYYLQHPNSMPTEARRSSDRHHHKVRGESYANTGSKNNALPNL